MDISRQSGRLARTRTHAISRVLHRTQFSRTEGRGTPEAGRGQYSQRERLSTENHHRPEQGSLAGWTRRFFAGFVRKRGAASQSSRRGYQRRLGSGRSARVFDRRATEDSPAGRQGERLYGPPPIPLQGFLSERPTIFSRP